MLVDICAQIFAQPFEMVFATIHIFMKLSGAHIFAPLFEKIFAMYHSHFDGCCYSDICSYIFAQLLKF